MAAWIHLYYTFSTMAPSGRGGLRRRTSNPVSPQTIGSSILPQSRHFLMHDLFKIY